MIEPVNDNILNLVNELYNNLDAKDKIINEQVLEIARLKETIEKAIDYIKHNLYCDYGDSCFDSQQELLEILEGNNNEE